MGSIVSYVVGTGGWRPWPLATAMRRGWRWTWTLSAAIGTIVRSTSNIRCRQPPMGTVSLRLIVQASRSRRPPEMRRRLEPRQQTARTPSSVLSTRTKGLELGPASIGGTRSDLGSPRNRLELRPVLSVKHVSKSLLSAESDSRISNSSVSKASLYLINNALSKRTNDSGMFSKSLGNNLRSFSASIQYERTVPVSCQYCPSRSLFFKGRVQSSGVRTSTVSSTSISWPLPA